MNQNSSQQAYPSEYQIAPEPNRGKNIVLIVFMIVTIIVAIAAIVVSVLSLNHKVDSDIEIAEYEVDANGSLIVGEPVMIRTNTPILQIYAELDEQTTIEDLLQKSKRTSRGHRIDTHR